MRTSRNEQRQLLGSLLFLAAMLSGGVSGFQALSQRQKPQQARRTRLKAVDPSSVATILATTAQHQHLQLQADPALSALLATAIDFGSIQSIHPAATNAAAAAAKTTTTETIQQLLPSAGEAVQSQAKEALENGYKVMDASGFTRGGGSSLPGFAETNSLLAPHVSPYPMSGTVTGDYPMFELGDRLALSYWLLEYVQRLPYIAFAYVLVEFFFLRSDVDLYKEDVEDDPSGVLAETVSDTGVRVGLFLVLTLFTYVVF
ncbi:unnamed protein product [Pseudo-nitzschia multistriata]|uniref:Uncharacterized protein n=1 Tax=Pseudo-nitzschia multistriata TaxID=183589 RepID=A0A448YZW9_9STRA|nr:unnamed protein product [Pseudo-nitzschia multistriata]